MRHGLESRWSHQAGGRHAGRKSIARHETPVGALPLESIALPASPGIDAICVRPADLSLTLGCTPELDQTAAPVVEALGKILDACKRHRVIAGLHTATRGYALKMVSQDWQLVMLASDDRFLAAKAAEEAAAVKQTVASGKLPAY